MSGPKAAIEVVAGITGIAAAVAWFVASTIRLDSTKSYYHIDIDRNVSLPALSSAMRANRIAALLTGISALLSSVANLI